MSALFDRRTAIVLCGFALAMGLNVLVDDLVYATDAAFFAAGTAEAAHRLDGIWAALAMIAGALALYASAGRAGLATQIAASFVPLGAGAAALGLLPSYAAAGAAASYGFLACRIVMAAGAGAALGSVLTFIAAGAPPRRRGTVIGLLEAACALLVIPVSLIAFTALREVAAADVTGTWRVLLVVYGLAVVVLTLVFRRGLAEPAPFAPPPPAARLPVLRVAFIGGAVLLAAQLVAAAVLIWGVERNAMPPATLMTWLPLKNAAIAAAAVPAGMLSDRFGRLPVLGIGALVLVVLGLPLLIAFGGGAGIGAFAATLATLVPGVAVRQAVRLSVLESLPAPHRAGILALVSTVPTALFTLWNNTHTDFLLNGEAVLAGLIMVAGFGAAAVLHETAPAKTSPA